MTAGIMWLTLLGIGMMNLFVFLWIIHWIFRFVFFGIGLFLEPIIRIMKKT